MDYKLAKIKRLILQKQVRFTNKARLEMLSDNLEELDIFESIMNATQLDKTINSANPLTGKNEKLYVIKGFSYDKILIYTKGKISNEQFYIFISSKRAL